MNKQEIRDTVNQLIEAWHDEDEARQQLDNYKVSHSPPKPPSQFEGLRDLFEFDELRRSYQGGLTNHQNQLEAAQKAYEEAGDKLGEVLPAGAGLHYTYQGERGKLEGRRYVILNTQGRAVVQWHRQPETPPP
jgi:hypothetical protein